MGRWKILYPVYSAELGGSQLLMAELIRRLDPQRFEAVVVAPLDGPLVPRLERSGIRAAVLGAPAGSVVSWLRLRALLRRESPALVHLYGARVFAAVARSLSIPVCEAVNMSRDQCGWSRFAAVDRLVSQLDRRIIAVSNAIRSQLIAHGIPAEKVAVVRPGVDTARFRPMPPDPALRRKLGAGREEILVCNVGRLVEQKGQADLLDAVALAVRRVPSLKLAVVGDGPLRAPLERQAARLGIADRVVFTGFRKDVERVLAAADVFALPSLWEPLASAPLEAMAAGVPVVSTDVEGMPEAIRPGETGLLVPAGSPADMAEAIALLASDRSLRKRLAEGGRRRVLAEFNVDRMVRETECVYKEILEERRRP